MLPGSPQPVSSPERDRSLVTAFPSPATGPAFAGSIPGSVVLACYFVAQGLSAQEAIVRVRKMRPGSIETTEQAEAVREFARRRQPDSA